MDGANFKSVEIENVTINWEAAKLRLETKELDSMEDANLTAEIKTPKWPKVANYNVHITHR